MAALFSAVGGPHILILLNLKHLSYSITPSRSHGRWFQSYIYLIINTLMVLLTLVNLARFFSHYLPGFPNDWGFFDDFFPLASERQETLSQWFPTGKLQWPQIFLLVCSRPTPLISSWQARIQKIFPGGAHHPQAHTRRPSPASEASRENFEVFGRKTVPK